MPTSFDALLPPEMARKAEDAGVAKAALPTVKMFLLAVLAGAFIALGAIFATTVTAGGGQSFGVARLLGGLVFSLGLILVVIAGAELFTGNNLIVMATASKRVSVRALLRNWAIVYLGNLVGSMLTAVVMFASGQYMFGGGAVGQNALAIAAHKTDLGFVQAILLGVMCNALVCLAVWLCMSARTVTDKVLAIVFPITAFVAAGFEHSVANMYFIPEGLFIKSWAPPEFWQSIGTTPETLGGLTWTNFIVANLVPVTIGNVIGGSVLVGLVYWFVYRRPSSQSQA